MPCWNLLSMMFMIIFSSVCPGGVSGLITFTMMICSPNLFAANTDFFHHFKSPSESFPFYFLQSTWIAIASNYSFLFLNFLFKYPSHGTLLYKTQICTSSESIFLRSSCSSFCNESVSIVIFTNFG